MNEFQPCARNETEWNSTNAYSNFFDKSYKFCAWNIVPLYYKTETLRNKVRVHKWFQIKLLSQRSSHTLYHLLYLLTIVFIVLYFDTGRRPSSYVLQSVHRARKWHVSMALKLLQKKERLALYRYVKEFKITLLTL